MIRIYLTSFIVGILLCFPFTANAKRMKCEDIQIPIFETEAAPKPYIVIGRAYVESFIFEVSRCRILQMAFAEKADAVIAFNVQSRQNINRPNCIICLGDDSDVAPRLGTGLLVRWATESEKGIQTISADTLIPVLQTFDD